MKFKNFLATTFVCALLANPVVSNINFKDNNQSCPTEYTTILSTPKVNLVKSSNQTTSFSIVDTALANKMMTLLGKSENKFSKNDLIEHNDFKPTKVQTGTEIVDEEEVPIYEFTAPKTFLDLSNSRITDISELCQFVWPETLKGIDLSKNNITEYHLEKIINFSNLTPSSEDLEYNETTKLTVNSDIANYVDVINLNLNNISLNIVQKSALDNTRFIYGFQKYEEKVFNNESPGIYYIKDSDSKYLNITATKNGLDIDIYKNTLTPIEYYGYGHYEFKISKIENSNISNINTTLKFSYFNMYIKDTFWVERKSLFNITKDDIVIEGLTEGYTISSDNAKTKEIGTSLVNITVTTNTKTWTSTHTFTVKDTKPPILKLKGGEVIYLAVNGQSYVEYGCIGLDSDDDISHNIDISGRVDITTPGTYYITYSLTDEYGNVATPIKRKVVVQEYSLQNISIAPLAEEFFTNEEIIISCSLPKGVNINNYKHLSYTWYYNNQEFITTTGDKQTGKSSITLLEPDAKKIKLQVVLTATLNDNTTESYASETITIDVERKSNNLSTTTIALLIALVVIMATIGIVIFVKKKRTNKKGNKKSPKNKNKKNKKDSSKSKGAFDNYGDIQVIKDFNQNNNDDPPSTMQM